MEMATYLQYQTVVVALLFMIIMMNMGAIKKRLTIEVMSRLKMHPVIYTVLYEDNKSVDYIKDVTKEGTHEGNEGYKITDKEYYKFDASEKFCVFNDTLGARQNFFRMGVIKAIPVKDITMDVRYDSSLFSMLLTKAYLHGRLATASDDKKMMQLITIILVISGASLAASLYIMTKIAKLGGG